MLTRYFQEAMRRARFKILPDGAYFRQIPGLDGVWAKELEEWLVLKIRLNDPIPRIGRVRLPGKVA
jgi:hypothetical protein